MFSRKALLTYIDLRLRELLISKGANVDYSQPIGDAYNQMITIMQHRAIYDELTKLKALIVESEFDY
jgi:hypothetical protein